MSSDPKGEWSVAVAVESSICVGRRKTFRKRLPFKIGGGKREGMCKFSVHKLNAAIRAKQTDANGKREQDHLHELFGLHIIGIVGF